jgi:multidrug efflux pump subunit AcrA (membrane-fusion protein)
MSRLALSACLCAALLACSTPREEAEPAAVPVAVGVAPVRRGEISATLTASGETAALGILRLASPVAGRVTELAVQPGDRIAAGAVAARILPLENEATLHGLDVLADAGALGDERPLARRLAGGIHDIPVRVPFAAVVAERLHNPGEQVAPNDVLLELFDPRTLVVVAQVPIRDSGAVRAGLPVDVEVGGTHLAGQVAALLPGVSPQALTVPVRIALSTPVAPPLLHAAALCRVTTARHADALLVPIAALASSTVEAEGAVMVAADGVARRRKVGLGLRTRDEIEVTAGLAEGEQVITEGHVGLPDGTPIVTQPARADAAPSEAP